jgi:hypothetical protein
MFENIPHYRFQKKLKLTELLGDLCLIRSELNFEINEYSKSVSNLTHLHNTIVHSGPLDRYDFIRLSSLKMEIDEKSKKVNDLIYINKKTTNKIIKLNEYDYIANPIVEKGITSTVKRAKIINKSFSDISAKISNLSLAKSS